MLVLAACNKAFLLINPEPRVEAEFGVGIRTWNRLKEAWFRIVVAFCFEHFNPPGFFEHLTRSSFFELLTRRSFFEHLTRMSFLNPFSASHFLNTFPAGHF